MNYNNHPDKKTPWQANQAISVFFAILFILIVWFCLNQKLIFGEDWISATYDNPDWFTNEGNLHTYGAWDMEAHIWKSEYIIKYFPNFQWNPYWYLGMPLIKYYQAGFYVVNILTSILFGITVARASIWLVIIGHLLATLMTFMLCLKLSKRKAWASAFCSIFLLANTFLTLRSYGWEPISVVFLFFYPLALLIFFKDPFKPFRLGLIITLALSYLAHPLIFFSLCMFMGLYLFSVGISHTNLENKLHPAKKHRHYIWQYIGLIFCSLLIGSVQFLPQITYSQVSSGAHMGVSYIPFYHVPFNVITLKDFFFDSGNLKGPGPIILIAMLLIIVAIYLSNTKGHERLKISFFSDPVSRGITMVLVAMVLFYYLEKYNLFPMNLLRSIQYHRIIPEFIVTAAALIASLSNIMNTKFQKIIYYTLLGTFVIASFVVIYNVQTHWQTTDSISQSQEFINEQVLGRISFPYTDQSLSVRSSFTEVSQVYGYYEQGVTNAYADELFSVSSGFHGYGPTVLYLKAANVGRFYVNMEEGERDKIMRELLAPLQFVYENGSRYGYFVIPLANPDYAQTLNASQVKTILSLEPQCRTMFKEKYCGSIGEEFVTSDLEEMRYLQEYVSALEKPSTEKVSITMVTPEKYQMQVTNASTATAVVVKMTYDSSFRAFLDKKEITIKKIGPDFMLLEPATAGNYQLTLVYDFKKSIVFKGAIASIVSLILILLFFIIKRYINNDGERFYVKGDLE